VEEVLGHGLLGGQVGDPRQGQDVVGAAGGEQEAREAQGVGGDHVVDGQAVDQQQGSFQLGRVGQQRAAPVGVGVGWTSPLRQDTSAKGRMSAWQRSKADDDAS
jgi:hypothetical protein